MTDIKTADLVDSHDTEVRFCHLPLTLYGRRRFFHGTIVTVKTFEDNVLLRGCLEQDGTGKVLVVDGGGSTRLAVVGDMIAALGRDNNWAGLVIHGGVRDVAELQAMNFGVYALGRSPKKSGKAGIGAVDVPVNFGGVDFIPRQTLYADDDGILVAARPVHEDAA